MTTISRRSILGSGSFLVAPSICRADNLMKLSGYNMDPIVIAFGYHGILIGSAHNQAIPYPSRQELARQFILATNSRPIFGYQLVRHSELHPNSSLPWFR